MEHTRGTGRALIAVRVPAVIDPAYHVPDGGSPGISHSVWLPPTTATRAPVFNETELPSWALERIAAQFLARGGTLGITHGPGPARTGLEPAPGPHAPDWTRDTEHYGPGEPLPALGLALVIADPVEHEPRATGEVSRAFWRALRRAVGPGRIVLAHTRQDLNSAGMYDPSGHIVADAQAAGLAYIQHHIIVHTRLLTQPLSAADPAERRPPRPTDRAMQPAHRRVHSDLIAFLA